MREGVVEEREGNWIEGWHQERRSRDLGLHRASHDLASQMKYGTGVNLILTKVLSIFVTEMRACSDIRSSSQIWSRESLKGRPRLLMLTWQRSRSLLYRRVRWTVGDPDKPLNPLKKSRVPFATGLSVYCIYYWNDNSHDSCLETRVQRNLSILMSFSSSTSYVDWID